MARTELVADVGEDRLVAGLLARYGALPAMVRVGPGDDAAVLDLSGPVVACTDTLVEGYDFRRDWSTAADVGVKVAAANLADIAAMGGRPLALLVSLCAPADLPTRWAGDLAAAVDAESRRAGAVVVGGDVSAAREIVVTGTALGVLDGPVVLRSGARSGDVIALGGRTGPSAAGLALLQAGHGPAPADPVLAGLIRAHLAPAPPYASGAAAARAGADAMIDTSDGLIRDAGRIAAASGVVLDLDPDALGLGDDLAHAAEVLSDPVAALRWALAGGEDHALLACFPAGAVPPDGFASVGRVRPVPAGGGPGVLVGGRPWVGDTGWQHFRAAPS